MAHQFADGHRVVRVLDDGLSVGTRCLGHLQVGELGDVLRHRIVEREPAFLVERHQCDARDGLGHRVDAENRVLGHGHAVRDVLFAVRLEVRDLAVPGNDGDDAGKYAPVDESLHRGTQFAESPRRSSRLRRVRRSRGPFRPRGPPPGKARARMASDAVTCAKLPISVRRFMVPPLSLGSTLLASGRYPPSRRFHGISGDRMHSRLDGGPSAPFVSRTLCHNSALAGVV